MNNNNSININISSDVKSDVPKPKWIIQELDRFVIGQQEAKRSLAVLVYQNFLRLMHNNFPQMDKKVVKSNMLMFGGTATGKSFLLKKLGEICKIPILSIDSTALTASGYVGNCVGEMLTDYFECVTESYRNNSSNHRIDLISPDVHASSGLIFFDEFDKKRCTPKEDGSRDSRDVGTARIQYEVLKLLEGQVIKKNRNALTAGDALSELDTTNISFILGGAFSDIDKIVNKRLGIGNMGLTGGKTQDLEEVYNKITVEDLKEYGLISELVGRVHNRVSLSKLTKEQLFLILRDSEDSPLNDPIVMLDQAGCELSFKEDAMKLIADRAFDLELGARGLKSILDQITQEYFFDAPKKVEVTYEKVSHVLNIDD